MATKDRIEARTQEKDRSICIIENKQDSGASPSKIEGPFDRHSSNDVFVNYRDASPEETFYPNKIIKRKQSMSSGIKMLDPKILSSHQQL